jgi:hypothetical protein
VEGISAIVLDIAKHVCRTGGTWRVAQRDVKSAWVAEETSRIQLKRCYAKLGIERQSHLARFVTQLAP